MNESETQTPRKQLESTIARLIQEAQAAVCQMLSGIVGVPTFAFDVAIRQSGHDWAREVCGMVAQLWGASNNTHVRLYGDGAWMICDGSCTPVLSHDGLVLRSACIDELLPMLKAELAAREKPAEPEVKRLTAREMIDEYHSYMAALGYSDICKRLREIMDCLDAEQAEGASHAD